MYTTSTNRSIVLRRTFRYRRYPTKDQVQILISCLTTCRYPYNEVLEDRKNAYTCCGVGLNYSEQTGQLKHLNPDTYSQVIPDVLRRLDKAFQNFVRRVKNDEKKGGCPRFQGKNRYDSFTYPQTGFKIKDCNLHLSKIGMTGIFRHRGELGSLATLVKRSHR